MSVIERDRLVDSLLDRIDELERRLAAVERLAGGALQVVESGTVGATEQAWLEVEAVGATGYVRVHAGK